MNFSFKKRIAFHYMIATAIIMAVVFGIIYLVVHETVYRNLDNDLYYEAEKHTHEITFSGDRIHFINKAEWEEREHREIEVNPVFVQLLSKTGQLMDKSPNLKADVLTFNTDETSGYFDRKLQSKSIRQIQLPIEQSGKTKGYILAAMSSESAVSVLIMLRNILLASYLVVLLVLYFTSRFLAGRSIIPIQAMTNTITQISKNNLEERVSLPPNQDEIYRLSSSFNDLLDRIKNALDREKQFTSDASHELRTPLSTLRGTLEVLIRKPRTQAEYEEKIKYSLSEIERMTSTLEQLLLLARLDTKNHIQDNSLVSLATLVDEALVHAKKQITEKALKINLVVNQSALAMVPHYYSHLIIDNILNNAIKYSKAQAHINIEIDVVDSNILCSIKDEGIGIKEADLAHIYESFFRSEPLNHKQISGNGLGLSIVKKCADAINSKLDIKSIFGQGTTVTITF